MTEFDWIFTVSMIVGVLAVVLGAVAYQILAERKISAWVQDRVGPNRVGPFGLLQPIADGLKMFLKEDIIPSHVDKVFYLLAPAVAAGTAMLALTVVPVGPTVSPPDAVSVENLDRSSQDYAQSLKQEREAHEAYLNQTSYVIMPGTSIGIPLSLAIGSLAVYGIILGGWSANSKYSLLGSMRSSAQIISYEIPLGMSIVGVVLMAGSLNLEKIIDWQAQHGWFVLYQPLAFLLFMTSVFAECNRLPFDLPEAEQELVGGYHTEYSSMKFGLFFLGEYTHMVTTSLLMAILFWGGWHFPGIERLDGTWKVVAGFGALALKVTLSIIWYMLVRWTIPRFRFDQLMHLAWKVMMPLALLNLLAVVVILEFFRYESWHLWAMTAVSLTLFFGAALITTRPNPHSTPKARLKAAVPPALATR